ncbi:MAG TPA: polysaccharide biosynthesis C-terminal domain-containing protein, partial [Ignavibacteria bacterium]|nr:polysaccharide biosynthesis C-terminal domain-containing protein [Ignavibacteria bacterium]
RGHGNTKTPFRLLLVVFSLKIILSPLLIFTFNFGIGGASTATMISYGSVFIIQLVLLKRRGFIGPGKKKLTALITDIKNNWKITKETI